MYMNETCIACMRQMQHNIVPADADPDLRAGFLSEIDEILATMPKDVASPWLVPVFAEVFNRYFSIPDLYVSVRREANEKALLLLPKLEAAVADSEDKLSCALAISRLGNYLDFAIIAADAAERKLDEALAAPQNYAIKQEELEPFRAELERAKTLLIIGDNAGEIVFDIVLIKTLKELYPSLEITYSVRGGISQNDATREDADFVGMDRYATVVDSGSCIPGTDVRFCSESFKQTIRKSDVVLAKGMGNFETMSGGDIPAYYLFICKCKRISEHLNKPLYTGVLYKEPICS